MIEPIMNACKDKDCCKFVSIETRRIATVRELRELCPSLILALGYLSQPPDDSCLCPVDLPATAIFNGFEYERAKEWWTPAEVAAGLHEKSVMLRKVQRSSQKRSQSAGNM